MELKNQLVLITGASGGIGLEMARILAKEGASLILCSRSEEKLCKIADSLKKEFSVDIHVISADLSAADAPLSVYEECRKRNLTVDLLINNAGAGLFGHSMDLSPEDLNRMIGLNINGLTLLCNYFGKDMAERKSGTILNIGSIAGNQPTPLFASYAASKSYVKNFSIAFRAEMKPKGVQVTCVLPGYVRTSFDDNSKITSSKYKKFSEKNSLSAEQVARIAIKAVKRKRSVVIAGVMNKIVSFFTGLIPKKMLAGIMYNTVLKMTQDQLSKIRQ